MLIEEHDTTFFLFFFPRLKTAPLGGASGLQTFEGLTLPLTLALFFRAPIAQFPHCW